jgi:glycine/D-amino acid oxidase-like deaminating enzyme
LAEVLVIGGGLAGSLVALALAERGASVQLVDAATASASSISYGGVPWWGGAAGPIGDLMATAPACWQRLETRHGPLGWQPCGLRLHWSHGAAARGEVAPALAAATALARRHLPEAAIERIGAGPGVQGEGERAGVLRLPYGRVDPPTLVRALPPALERAGVGRHLRRVAALRPEGACWSVTLEPAEGLPQVLQADQVVVAAGAGSRALWPSLPQRLGASWAGLLVVEDPAERRSLLASGQQAHAPLGDGTDIVMPLLGQRQRLESRATDLTTEAWIVDPGFAPWGAGLLLGQSTLVRPGGEAGPAPAPVPLEERLRQVLTPLLPGLAQVRARFRQTLVSFSGPGGPLVGPVPGARGLWVCAGFAGPFALVPPLAPLLAAAICGDRLALGNLERLAPTGPG